MAQPITWQNVTGPSLAEAARPMEAAVNTFNNAFTPLQEILKKREITDLANMKQGRENLTQELLNQVYAPTTVEGFQQTAPAIQQRMAGLGAGVDQAAVRTAMDARAPELQKRTKDTWAFDEALRVTTEAPLVGQGKSLIMAGNYDEARKIMAQLSPQARAEMTAALDARQRELTVRTQTDGRYAKDLERTGAEIIKWQEDAETAKKNAESSSIQANASVAGVAVQRDRLNAENLERLEERRMKLVTQRAGLTQTVGTPEGFKLVLDELPKIFKDKSGDELAKATQAVGALMQSADFASASPAAVLAAITADRDTGTTWLYSNTGKGVEAKLKKIMDNFNTSEAAQNRAELKAFLDQQIQALDPKVGLGVTAPTAAPGTPGTPGRPSPGGTPAPGAPGAAGAPPPAVPPPAAAALGGDIRQEYARQTAEINALVRPQNGYSPEVRQAIEADRKAGERVAAELESRRVEASKKAGIRVPTKPGDVPVNAVFSMLSAGLGGPMGYQNIQRTQNEDYKRWAEAMDRRLADSDAKAGKAR